MSTRLYVGNLSYQTTEEGLRALFDGKGWEVTSVAVIMDRETGRPRGFAFVELGSPEDARAALAALDGAELDGRNLRINEARERESRGPGGPPRFGGGPGGPPRFGGGPGGPPRPGGGPPRPGGGPGGPRFGGGPGGPRFGGGPGGGRPGGPPPRFGGPSDGPPRFGGPPEGMPPDFDKGDRPDRGARRARGRDKEKDRERDRDAGERGPGRPRRSNRDDDW